MLRKYSGRTTVLILCIANKPDLIGIGASVLNSFSPSSVRSVPPRFTVKFGVTNYIAATLHQQPCCAPCPYEEARLWRRRKYSYWLGPLQVDRRLSEKKTVQLNIAFFQEIIYAG